ncbi:MAG: LysR family transcriptional regulator [Firmicutes bacterium]|nr:LysR family transcriptional regulator [Bacillota bacterium]
MSSMLRLKYFVSLADNLSFTKAAQECFIVQTAMSRQIAALESELGVQLFVRNTRTVELTEAGKEFYSYAVSALNDYNRGVERAKLVSANYDWTLKIGIGPQEHLLLEPLLSRFVEQFPQTAVIVDQMGYRNLQKYYREGAYDIILGHRKRLPEFDDANRITFPGIKWGIILSDKNPLAAKEQINPEDMAGQTFVSMTSINMAQFEEAVHQSYPGSKFISANSIPLKYVFVRMNMAIAYMPGFLSKDMPSGIIFKESEWMNDPILQDRDFDLVYRVTAHERQAQAEFIKISDEYITSEGDKPWMHTERE